MLNPWLRFLRPPIIIIMGIIIIMLLSGVVMDIDCSDVSRKESSEVSKAEPSIV